MSLDQDNMPALRRQHLQNQKAVAEAVDELRLALSPAGLMAAGAEAAGFGGLGARLSARGAQAPRDDWRDEAAKLHSMAAATLVQIDAALAASDPRDPALLARRDAVEELRDIAIRKTLERGLDTLTPAERAQIVALRETEFARGSRLGARDPLANLALAAAVGVVAATLLPRSRVEAQVMARANRQLRMRAGGVADSVVDSLGGIAREVLEALIRTLPRR